VSEFDFEVRLCARLETAGYPGEGAATEPAPIVARQLGGGVHDPGTRVVDAVLVHQGPEFEERAAITAETIPGLAIRADVPTGRAIPRREAFADLEVSPERQRAVIERAARIGFFERERRDDREVVRQVAAYPDWHAGLTAIENKPDLGRPGDLDRQLRFDVALASFDRVVLATGSHVTRAHLNRIPDPVGVWRFRAGEIEVVREPAALPAESPAVEIVGEHPGRTDVVPVTAGEKARARRRVAERAYGKGFRTYEFPACARFEAVERDGAGGLPYCGFHGRLVDPASTCGPGCPSHDPAPAPEVDPEAARDRNAPWEAAPEGLARRQSGLDRFGSENE